jgi:demethylmenaquinone methyltransferase/2-methoxy-6-polyprenyl-1,4-benzoquinol methylase
MKKYILLTTESNKNLVPKFFDNTATTYDKVAHWATLGKDTFWKNEILKQIPEVNSILDLACGTGILTRKIAKKFPNTKIVGVDITETYLNLAKKNSASYNNISYVHQDAENLNLNLKFDCITSSYIPKYCDAEILVKKCLNHLNPKGKIIFHDFTYPKKVAARKIWNIYFALLNFVGFFIPSWKEAFIKLPKLIKTSTWLSSYANVMKKNGLQVKFHYLTWDSCAILIGNKISDVKS